MINYQVMVVSKQLSKIGGVQTVVKQLGILLKKQAIDITTLSFDEQSVNSYNKFIKDLFKIIGFHLKGTEAVIYTITGYQIIIYSIISLFFRKKIIYWEHGHPDFLNNSKSYKILKKYFYPYSKAIVITHPKFNTQPNLPFIYIPNPYVSMEKKFFNLNKTEIKKVIWVGRISEEKQPNLAFAAMVKSAEVNKNVEFYFVHSPLKKDIINIPVNLKLIDGFNYSPEKILDAHTVLLLTSTAEAMPGVVFEALANGSTILSSSCTPWIDDISKITGNSSFNPIIDISNLSIEINEIIKKGNNIKLKYLLDLFNQINPTQVTERWKSVLMKNKY